MLDVQQAHQTHSNNIYINYKKQETDEANHKSRFEKACKCQIKKAALLDDVRHYQSVLKKSMQSE